MSNFVSRRLAPSPYLVARVDRSNGERYRLVAETQMHTTISCKADAMTTSNEAMTASTPNRWAIAAAGVIMQVGLARYTSGASLETPWPKRSAEPVVATSFIQFGSGWSW